MRTNTYRTHGGLGTRTETWNRRGEGSPKGRTGRFEGTQFVTVAELNARDAHRRALELEKSKQAGELAVENRRQIGETNRQGMTTGLDRDKFGFDKETSARDFGYKSKTDERDFGLKKDEFSSVDAYRKGGIANEGYRIDLDSRKQKWNEFSAANALGANTDHGDTGIRRSGPEVLAGFRHYQGEQGSGAGSNPSLALMLAGQKDPTKVDIPQHLIDSVYGRQEKAAPGFVADGAFIDKPKPTVRKKRSEPIGSSFMRTNLAQYSGLKGLQMASEALINRPLRQTLDWSKRAGKWALQEKK
jgi:hypothetical protein